MGMAAVYHEVQGFLHGGVDNLILRNPGLIYKFNSVLKIPDVSHEVRIRSHADQGMVLFAESGG